MKQFCSFVNKEFLHIFRDRRTMLVLLVMPIILILLFGYAVTNETKGSRLAIVDESHDVAVTKLREHINSNKYFDVVADLQTSVQLEELFAKSEIDVALIIPEGFPEDFLRSGDNGLQILVDGSEPNQASVRANYLQQILMGAMSDNQTQFNAPISMGEGVGVRLLYNPQGKSEYNFVPGVIGMILLLICAMMTSISIVREKELGTMEVLLTSPLHPLVILIAKLIPYFAISVINVATIMLLSRFVIGVPIAGNLLVFFGITLLYIIVALSLGMLISTAVSTQLAAMLLSLLLIVPSIYLSGMVFPIESMPLPMQKVSNIVPATWFIDAARKLMIQGVDVRFVLKDIAVLFLQATILLALSLKLFKTRLS